MLTIRYSDYFIRSARKLSRKQHTKLAALLELLSINPFHPKLQTKHLTGKLSGLYSFRIAREFILRIKRK